MPLAVKKGDEVCEGVTDENSIFSVAIMPDNLISDETNFIATSMQETIAYATPRPGIAQGNSTHTCSAVTVQSVQLLYAIEKS